VPKFRNKIPPFPCTHMHLLSIHSFTRWRFCRSDVTEVYCWIIIAVFTNNQRTVLKTFYEWNCIESNKAVRIHLFSPQFKLFVVWNQADCGLIHRNVLFYGVYLLELPDCIASPVCWHQIDDIHWLLCGWYTVACVFDEQYIGHNVMWLIIHSGHAMRV